MKLIEGIQSIPSQLFRFPFSGGALIFQLDFRPSTQEWYITITFKEIVYRNIRLVKSYNILKSYLNTFGFGLWVYTPDAIDPMFINDFSSGRCKLFFLESDDL